MKIISDLHIHSKYSRATSKELNIENLEKYAKIKGVNLLGTGDFTHPIWIKELKVKLKEDKGILKTKNNFPFILQSEISLIYTQDNKGRRVHNVILAPSFEIVDQITEYLLKYGRIDYDGRPIFKIPCYEFTESLMQISKDIEIIPAHIWTPWFSLFGSNSGFNTVEECFKDQTKNIHALETGLSSDPAMNWRLSQLDKYSLVSFSDLHSFWPWRMGREATIFELKELTYNNLIKAIREKKGLLGTIEVEPSYGKYHLDGHRLCKVCMEPKESLKHHNLCPKCGKKLTIGVLNRIEELADRKEGFKPKGAVPFRTLIPLSEILGEVLGISQLYSKKIWEEYNKLIKNFDNELNISLNVPLDKLKLVVNEKIAEVIIKNREGKINIQPGFDGQYGKPVFNDKIETQEKKYKRTQKSLGDF